jgi:hypothetical protein
MLDQLGDELREPLEPAIYVEPKDKRPDNEDDRQAVFVAAMRRQPQFRISAVPNGGKRTQWAAAKAKREGMIAGEPDVSIAWADHPTVRIEFKNGSDMPRQNQIDALNWYHRRGHPVAVCRTCEGALTWLRSIGAPVSVRVSA